MDQVKKVFRDIKDRGIWTDDELLTYRPVRLPMKFVDVEQEVNFVALSCLLDFGSFYNQELLSATGKTIQDVVRFGLIGLHISNVKIDTEFMVNATVSSVARIFSCKFS